MRKYAIVLLSGLFILGCMSKPECKKTLVKINNYEISAGEFEQEFRDSPYGQNDTDVSRKDFLNTMINRKLILQDAQKKGFDKLEGFLKMVERFWEQSLLKLSLDIKSKEIAASASVSDKEVKDAYEAMVKEKKTDKSYDQMYQIIKWQLTRQKEYQMMSDWVESLRKGANIEVYGDLILEDKGEK